ncbi:hypothetical protein [Gallaecimonas pentaromativorans]|uniref:Uncharacterized protein n=1 Tax=Gallaecimonas pentaromativorans TaxID=584787 RepID=A0A3N1NWJ8_9GAMM|nr:hypothetical protein [Gallaecimonas pentaromativorans]ROQ24204.1 hypothetical protein EDC28_10785 [Gallaecimonas pentaromativorans]
MGPPAEIAITVYSLGLLGWYGLWHALVGYPLLAKLKYLRIPFWGAQFVFVANVVLGYYTPEIDYQTELALYPYVEANATTVASMSLAIAVFWVFVSKDKPLEEAGSLVKIFLWLLLWSFLISVMGALPLYWVPPGGYWLMTLRHLKCLPFFYSLFLLSSALIVFMYELRYRRTHLHELSPIAFSKDVEDWPPKMRPWHALRRRRQEH